MPSPLLSNSGVLLLLQKESPHAVTVIPQYPLPYAITNKVSVFYRFAYSEHFK